MSQQNARVAIHAASLIGTRLIVNFDGQDMPLENNHDHVLNLKPGTTVTLKVEADERWEKAQAGQPQEGLRDLDQDARTSIAASPQAGADLSGSPRMEPLPGSVVTEETAATRTRSTR